MSLIFSMSSYITEAFFIITNENPSRDDLRSIPVNCFPIVHSATFYLSRESMNLFLFLQPVRVHSSVNIKMICCRWDGHAFSICLCVYPLWDITSLLSFLSASAIISVHLWHFGIIFCWMFYCKKNVWNKNKTFRIWYFSTFQSSVRTTLKSFGRAMSTIVRLHVALSTRIISCLLCATSCLSG